MKCKLINREELISRYLLSTLTEEESLEFEEHYFQCKECYQELKDSEKVVDYIKLEGDKLLDKKSVNNNFSAESLLSKLLPGLSSPVRWGIAFGSISAVFIIFYLIFKSPELNDSTQPIFVEDKIMVQDSIDQNIPQQQELITQPKKTNNESLAALTGPAYNPNEYYEMLIVENVRSEHNTIEKVISPEIGERISSGRINFNFKIKRNIPLELKVLNNSEEIIYSSLIDQNTYPEINITISQRTIKNSGLYYWRIEDEREVYYVGKFYFIKE